MKLHACHPRRRFSTVEAARADSANISIRQRVLRLPEPCSKCNGWHLSQGK